MSHLGIFVYNPTDIKKIAMLIRNIYEKKNKKKLLNMSIEKINI